MKLYYFDIFGKADAIRMTLDAAKVPFEDVRINHEQLATMKEAGKLEFGQVPALEVGGHMYTQSMSIVRMLGKQYGFYTDDAVTGWEIDSAIDACQDIQNAYYKFSFESDAERKKAGQEAFLKTQFPAWTAVMDKRIASNTSPHYIVGNKITIADFVVGSWVYGAALNEAGPLHSEMKENINQHAHLKEYLTHLGENDLKEFLDHRPKPRTF